MRDADQLRFPGLGDTQRQLLHALKRRGPSTTGELAEGFDLARGTLREHLKSLEARRLVERAGTKRHGPGRPHVIYGLTDAGEALFPTGEAELLVEFIEYLLQSGQEDVIDTFFEQRVDEAYAEAAARVEGMTVEHREREAVRILADAGFMPELEKDEETGETVIRLCNCPLKSVIAVSRRPCAAEERFVSQLVDAELERFAYMPDGDDSCSYVIRRPGE
ncbi:MAG: helix-turn-helix transcriptional regulator [Gemmatimonadota bacterium]